MIADDHAISIEQNGKETVQEVDSAFTNGSCFGDQTPCK